jgi:adenosylhomocysteine nucleosidase
MIGIIGALDIEVALLLKQMISKKVVKRSGVTFFRGKLSGVPVVVCVSGIGKVNAAKTTQTLIDRFKVKAIIFTGVAGSIAPTLKIGESVISTKTQQYDVNFTAIGFPPGVIPGLKTSVFPAAPFLIRLAQRAARSIPQVKARLGKILSGDRFVASQAKAQRLRRLFGGVCVEAEGAATGQVCFLNKVPYVVIRTMSDRADRQAPQEFDRFTQLAARRSQLIVLKMLRALGSH